jgi:hypothetical protein
MDKITVMLCQQSNKWCWTYEGDNFGPFEDEWQARDNALSVLELNWEGDLPDVEFEYA